jgi:hypothetical protein
MTELQRQLRIREFMVEIADELQFELLNSLEKPAHPFSGFTVQMKGAVLDLVMAILARHDGEVLVNDPTLPVPPLPDRRGSS